VGVAGVSTSTCSQQRSGLALCIGYGSQPLGRVDACISKLCHGVCVTYS
jgi:hypothetical protein